MYKELFSANDIPNNIGKWSIQPHSSCRPLRAEAWARSQTISSEMCHWDDSASVFPSVSDQFTTLLFHASDILSWHIRASLNKTFLSLGTENI